MWVWVSMYGNILMFAGGLFVIIAVASIWLPGRPADEARDLTRRLAQLTAAIVGVAMVSWVLFADRAGDADPRLFWEIMEPGRPLRFYGSLVMSLMAFGMAGIGLAVGFELTPPKRRFLRRVLSRASVASALATVALFPMVPIYIAAAADLRPPS